MIMAREYMSAGVKSNRPTVHTALDQDTQASRARTLATTVIVHLQSSSPAFSDMPTMVLLKVSGGM